MTPARTPEEVAALNAVLHAANGMAMDDYNEREQAAMHAALAPLLVRPAAWTKVTDDPGSWPPDEDGPLVLMEFQTPIGGEWRREVYADSANARRDVARMMLPPIEYACHWMPWPSATAPAREDEAERLRGLIREWAEADAALGAARSHLPVEQRMAIDDRLTAVEAALRAAAGGKAGE